MTTPATYDDANLILRLYEMRRETKMREARAWFVKNFYCKTVEEYQHVAPPGTDENAYMRQVITYWEMVASLITSGVLNEHLFFQSGQELLLVWTRIEKVCPTLRSAFGNPGMWRNIEEVAGRYIAYMNQNAAGAYEAFAARVSPHR
ncbi:hypothetical protein F183_A01340 [Bryobacterales bacterium F-183]|nr:hypothetical protein F183_A01340 [Bryobacterales bacterium F-183]